MKYLLLIAIVGVVLWLMKTKARPPAPRGGDAARKSAAKPGGPVAMLACAHCGVHLPQSEAVLDGGSRPYCSEAHRLAGPR